ncbi:MAG: helix-turn-helix domain-containing protein [Coriobacteriales bacterium]|jgi:hypothetical protein|nr:helix-turn-helix domain-containing protein [Coriobacteriales bacterium]
MSDNDQGVVGLQGSLDLFRFSLALLRRKLQDYVLAEQISEQEQASLETFRVFDPSAPELSPKCLYICPHGMLPKLYPLLAAASARISLIIVVGNEVNGPEELALGDNDYLLIKGISVPQVLNHVIIDVDFWKIANGRINRLLAAKAGIQELIDVLSDYARMPLACMDVNHGMLALSEHHCPSNDIFWRAMQKSDRQAINEIVDRLPPSNSVRPKGRNGFLQRNIDILGHEALQGRIYASSHLLAYLWALPDDQLSEHFTTADRQLFNWICDKVSYWMSSSSVLPLGRDSKQEIFLLDLVDGLFSDPGSCLAAARASELPFNPEAPMQMLVVRLSDPNPENRERILDLLERIEQIIPHSVCAIYHNDLVCLFNAAESAELEPKCEVALDQLAHVYRAYVIIGNLYNRIVQSKQAYRQLCQSFTFLNCKAEAYGIYHYYDLAVLQCNLAISTQQPLETAIHPLVRRVVNWDKQHDTDYLKTLKAYLNYRGSITEAAAYLKMHRNTLLYRLGKIQELLQTEFKDWNLRRLMLYSIDMMHFSDMLEQNDFSGDF